MKIAVIIAGIVTSVFGLLFTVYACVRVGAKSEMNQEKKSKFIPNFDDCSVVKCSECGLEYTDRIKRKHCANCGTKVKGEDNELDKLR